MTRQFAFGSLPNHVGAISQLRWTWPSTSSISASAESGVSFPDAVRSAIASAGLAYPSREAISKRSVWIASHRSLPRSWTSWGSRGSVVHDRISDA